MPATGRITELFPHVRQVFMVERYSYGPDGSLLGAVAVLGITSLAPGQAGPGDLLAYLRGHWAIEMHDYVRDVTFGEDTSRVSRAHQAKAAVPQHRHRDPAPAPGTEHRRAAARLPSRPMLAPAAAPRPHRTTDTDPKPRRGLNATIPPNQGQPFRRTYPGKPHMTSINTNQLPDPLNKGLTLQAPCLGTRLAWHVCRSMCGSRSRSLGRYRNLNGMGE
jgi:hypothetical protein